MEMTNKYSVPEIVVSAKKYVDSLYDKGEATITTTQLTDPVLLHVLRQRHKDELIEDVSEGLWSLLGSSLHMVMEKAAKPGAIAERRFYADFGKEKVGGKIDLYEDGVLYDFKVTSVWTLVFGKKEYEEQANINRYLMHRNGIEVKRLANILYFRDWIKSKADTENGGKYPPVQVIELDLPMWSLDGAEYFIRSKLDMIERAFSIGESELLQNYPCSMSDRWFNKKTGKFNRCLSYCPVRQFCPIGRNLQ